MRIAQITPGVIPIPPNGWGAVEKIIWEYTQTLRKLGHRVDIIYADEANIRDWDIVHVHMANLALILRDRGIPYIFSHHDHHAFHYGIGSDVYKQNKEAIEGSLFSFVHARYLVDYFNVPGKIRYLGHGANLEDYQFSDRSKDLLMDEASLVMMANNGLASDRLYDRKGFGPAIEAAKKLNLPITILCKKDNNKEIIERFDSYEKLNVIYDLGYQESIEELKKHHLFLNPSMLEAGHPNLTVTESISMGIPVIGTAEQEIPGLRRVELKDLKVSTEDLASKISEVVSQYSTLVLECKKQRGLLSWEVVVSRMLMDYSKYGGISQKKMLLDNYSCELEKAGEKNSNPGYYVRFNPNPYVYKSRRTDADVSVSFLDKATGKIVHKSTMGKGPRSWIIPATFPQNFIHWDIIIKEGVREVFREEMKLKNQHVLVTGIKPDDESAISDIEFFSKRTDCIVSLEFPRNSFFHFPGGDKTIFYAIFSIEQIRDFFKTKEKVSRKVFLDFSPGSLGDNLAFVPYASKYAETIGEKVFVKSAHRDLFEGIYSNLEFVNDTDCTEYSLINYLFDQPLQKGFCSQLGLDFSEIRPRIRKPKIQENGIKGPYICFSKHSTAQAKHWNNPEGWEKLCAELSKEGLTPVCIDRFRSFGIDGHWNEIPKNCVDKTGGDLEKMMSLIEGCEFFIGLSSGLSWLAHALGKKVVMISGVTTVDNEFSEDCIRIHRNDLCNSCFNNPEEHEFNPGDWLWCPVHQNTGKQFECTKRISSKQVMDRIKEAGWIYTE
jgi:autotransporter strand-loop-strand O-heptosyltransferase